MKFFEIVFILLLMLPLALLMRYFVTRLSAQAPRQRRSVNRPEEEKPSIRKWYRKKHPKPEPEQQETKRDQPPDLQPMPQMRPQPQTRPHSQTRPQPQMTTQRQTRPQPGPPEPERIVAEYRPRSHTSLRRTQRIPFTEMYQQAGVESRPGVPNTPGHERRSVDAGRGRVSRSEAKGFDYDGSRAQGTGLSDADAEKKRVPRSRKSPSKRQKRKNRARARKREQNRRSKEE